jgi:hypothetical protein
MSAFVAAPLRVLRMVTTSFANAVATSPGA